MLSLAHIALVSYQAATPQRPAGTPAAEAARESPVAMTPKKVAVAASPETQRTPSGVTQTTAEARQRSGQLLRHSPSPLSHTRPTVSIENLCFWHCRRPSLFRYKKLSG